MPVARRQCGETLDDLWGEPGDVYKRGALVYWGEQLAFCVDRYMPTAYELARRIRVIDSHTAGEPTRCVLEGGPDLGVGTVAEKLPRLRQDFDLFRRAVILEPRGSDVVVGALLVEPAHADSATGVIFFNNTGYLGMCGHGTIGVAATLAYLGRIGPGQHRFETPVGDVMVSLANDGSVTVANVPAYRLRAGVMVDVPGYGVVQGDIAWGGNWFFLAKEDRRRLVLDEVEELTEFTWAIRQALRRSGITGAEGAEIDHIELYGAAHVSTNSGRNFVLCPGKAYDRSPCGTGTSAKLACLAADGKLEPGQAWRQEGILGTVFTGTYDRDGERIHPHITGAAYVTAEATLIFDPRDPFVAGIAGDVEQAR
jgi:4-hydroxyproline epimerase